MTRNSLEFKFVHSYFFHQVTQFLESQGFLDYVERCLNSEESNLNLLDKLQDASGRGQNPSSIFPSLEVPEIKTIAQPDAGIAGLLNVFLPPLSFWVVNFISLPASALQLVFSYFVLC